MKIDIMFSDLTEAKRQEYMAAVSNGEKLDMLKEACVVWGLVPVCTVEI